jgi:8-oxo-dGTP diphosphatase
MLKRFNTGYMDGYYCFPAGKLEDNEFFSEGAIREGLEEVGLRILPAKLKPILIQHRKSNSGTWVDVYFELLGDYQPINAEPHKCSSLDWLTSGDPLIAPWQQKAIDNIEAGLFYSEVLEPEPFVQTTASTRADT